MKDWRRIIPGRLEETKLFFGLLIERSIIDRILIIFSIRLKLMHMLRALFVVLIKDVSRKMFKSRPEHFLSVFSTRTICRGLPQG